MKGLAVALLALLAAAPVAAAGEPLVPDIWWCPVDVPFPVIHVCIVTLDHPQDVCIESQIGGNYHDICVANPDFPPSLMATPGVTCIESDDPLAHVCLYTYGGPDEGCLETRSALGFRGTCWTLPGVG